MDKILFQIFMSLIISGPGAEARFTALTTAKFFAPKDSTVSRFEASTPPIATQHKGEDLTIRPMDSRPIVGSGFSFVGVA